MSVPQRLHERLHTRRTIMPRGAGASLEYPLASAPPFVEHTCRGTWVTRCPLEGACVRPVGPPRVEISSGSNKLFEHNARFLVVLGVRNKQKNRRSRLKNRPKSRYTPLGPWRLFLAPSGGRNGRREQHTRRNCGVFSRYQLAMTSSDHRSQQKVRVYI